MNQGAIDNTMATGWFPITSTSHLTTRATSPRETLGLPYEQTSQHRRHFRHEVAAQKNAHPTAAKAEAPLLFSSSRQAPSMPTYPSGSKTHTINNRSTTLTARRQLRARRVSRLSHALHPDDGVGVLRPQVLAPPA